MASSWFPILITLSASAVMATASYSACRRRPNHSLVSDRSIWGAVLFAISFVSYLASATLLLLYGINDSAIVAATAGLFICAFAYAATKPKHDQDYM